MSLIGPVVFCPIVPLESAPQPLTLKRQQRLMYSLQVVRLDGTDNARTNA